MSKTYQMNPEFYKQRYSGSLFLIKAGGRIIMDDDARRDLLRTIQDFINANIRVLLVYGGGHAIDDALKERNIEPRKIDGRRITNAETIEVVKSVISGDLSFRIARTMARIGLNGVLLNNIPAEWIDIKFRERENPEEYGYDGTIENVNASSIYTLMNATPFIACPCLGASKNNAVNINADNVAVGIASQCQFRKLIFMSDIDGVMVDGKVSSVITDKEIPGLISDGHAVGGMQVKLENCLHALDRGVRRIHIINGFKAGNLANEIYSSVGPGTMLIRESDMDRYEQETMMEIAP